jgi:hypothetical protein
MVYRTQNYWVFGHFPLFGVVESRNTTFWKLDLFPSSREGGANLNHWTTHQIYRAI